MKEKCMIDKEVCKDLYSVNGPSKKRNEPCVDLVGMSITVAFNKGNIVSNCTLLE
jgi:hypothetical protein